MTKRPKSIFTAYDHWLVKSRDPELDITEKEVLWASTIGGSRLKKIVDPIYGNPSLEFKIMTGQIENPPLTSYNAEKTAHKLDIGRHIEETIVNLFREKAHLGNRLVIDKRTFAVMNPEFLDNDGNPLLTFNLDAFVMTDSGYEKWKKGEITDDERINYVKYVVEIKNSELDQDKLRESYKYQTWDYYWKTNAQQPTMLVYLKSGYLLDAYQYTKEEYAQLEAEVWPKLIDFVAAVKTGIEPAPDLTNAPGDNQEIVLNGEDPLVELITRLNEVQTKKKALEAEEKVYKAQLTQLTNELYHAERFQKNTLITDQYTTTITNYKGRATKDWEGLMSFNNLQYLGALNTLKDKYGLNLTEFMKYEQTPEVKLGSPYQVIAIKPVKEKKPRGKK